MKNHQSYTYSGPNLKKTCNGKKETRQVQEPNFEFVLASNPNLKDKDESPKKLDSGRGPMAMSFYSNLGWTVESLGPKSGHWK